MSSREELIENKVNKLHRSFLRKGILIAIMSGFFYGPYSGFITLGTQKGIWGAWSSGEKVGAFFATIVVGALASIINDCFSVVWAAINLFRTHKIKDYLSITGSKPWRTLSMAAFMGGPVANTATVIAIRVAGSAVIPITALSCAFGAVFGRLLYKQPLNLRMGLGILICFLASTIIGLAGSSGEGSGNMFLGIILALIAAAGWGIEGCIGGYSTVVIDPEIAIMIRQQVSVVGGLFIVLPVLSVIGGNLGLGYQMAILGLTDFQAMPFLIASGLSTILSYMNWYRGSGICGAALGMSCNGAYSFWGPLWCWIILGLFAGQEGWNLPLSSWLASVLMVFGIILIAFNPLAMIRNRRKERMDEAV